MRQFFTIATNAFMELVRQPVFLLLMTCSALFNVFLAAVPYFGFGDADTKSLGIFCGALALAYAIGGFTNYFLSRPFAPNAVAALVVMATLAFVFITNFTTTTNRFGQAPNAVDWRLAPASVLILL